MQLEQKSPEYYYETGWPVNIVNRLNISMGLYRRNYNYVKIGITSNPQKRFKQHQESCKYNWERMVVVYVTKSPKNANYIEKWFINNRYDDLVNEWTGYSPMCNSDFYYVYILLGNHKRRKM